MKKQTWHKVTAPKPWRPKPGEEIIGTYCGSKTKEGKYGEYRVHYIKCRGHTWYVSGVVVNDLFDVISEEMKVKLVFNGTKKVKDKENEVKLFEMYTEEEVELKLFEVA